VLLAVFTVNERHAAQPIMPLNLLASRERAGAYLARFFYLGAMIGFFYFSTQFMQDILGLSPLQAGLGFLPMTAVNFAVAMSIPRLIRRLGGTTPLVAGIALTLVGMVWLSRLNTGSGYLTGLAAPMVLIGAGQGLTFAPLTSAGIVGATARDAGAASGLVNTFHQVGMAFGLGVLVAVAAHARAGGASTAARLAAQVSAALTAGSILLALSLIAALALIVPAAATRRHDIAAAHEEGSGLPVSDESPAYALTGNK
jgi:predicted MFS family arabinose efflux permease